MDEYTIYIHTAPNGKKYVGLTSVSPQKRFGRNGSHYKCQKLFWRAIQKYGWDNFKHEIVLEGLDKEQAVTMERKLIKEFKTYLREYGYNLSLGGDGVKGAQSPTKWRRVDVYDLDGHLLDTCCSAAEAGRKYHVKSVSTYCTGKKKTAHGKYVFRYSGEAFDKYPVEHITCGKSVDQYTSDGDYIGSYNSIKEAEQKIGVTGIACSCIGKTEKCGGYVWRYSNEEYTDQKFFPKQLGKSVSKFDWYGNHMQDYENSASAGRATHTNEDNISAVCRGEKPSAGGYVWRFFGDAFEKYDYDYSRHYEILRYDKNNNLLATYKDVSEAKKATGILAITDCCKGRRASAGGSIWKYKGVM